LFLRGGGGGRRHQVLFVIPKRKEDRKTRAHRSPRETACSDLGSRKEGQGGGQNAAFSTAKKKKKERSRSIHQPYAQKEGDSASARPLNWEGEKKGGGGGGGGAPLFHIAQKKKKKKKGRGGEKKEKMPGKRCDVTAGGGEGWKRRTVGFSAPKGGGGNSRGG